MLLVSSIRATGEAEARLSSPGAGASTAARRSGGRRRARAPRQEGAADPAEGLREVAGARHLEGIQETLAPRPAKDADRDEAVGGEGCAPRLAAAAAVAVAQRVDRSLDLIGDAAAETA